MRRSELIRSVWPKAKVPLGSRRDRLAMLLALVTFACLSAAFVLSEDTKFLMPGPLASAHGGVDNCNACHTNSGSGKLSWVRGLIAGDPLADSKACLTCHQMPNTAFNAHGATLELLKQSTSRLTKTAAATPTPRSAQAQNIAFPARSVVSRGLACATCHQEHQGAGFDLRKVSNERCRSCHVVKFDSFDGHHPEFESYPFKRRQRIIYDHASHFSKHYPELAKKDAAKHIPQTCSTCHNSREDKRLMAVAPFEQTCAGCHLDQITGKERISGPKGIAFLSLPGLDLQTLKKKNASIGEWPDASEAALTPFMKVMISRNERGRGLIETIESLNLQDLTAATDDQIEAVTTLVWEIKGLFYALIKGKASDVLIGLNIAGGAQPSADLIADLTASIPRDVVISAYREWLPNLAREMANRPVTSDQDRSDWSTVIRELNSPGSAAPGAPSDSASRQTAPKHHSEAAGSEAAIPGKAKVGGEAVMRSAKELPPAMRVGIKDTGNTPEGEETAAKSYTTNAGPHDGEETPFGGAGGSGTITRRWSLPSGTPRAIRARNEDDRSAKSEKGAGPSDASAGKLENGERPRAADEQPRATKGDKNDAGMVSQTEGESRKPDALNAKTSGGEDARAVSEQPPAKTTDQSDDLLFPTEEELRAMKRGNKVTENAGRPEGSEKDTETTNAQSKGAAPARAASGANANAPAGAESNSSTAAAVSQTRTEPATSIEGDVDPESWAEYGGWYRQDYAIFYRPTRHKDKFIYSWLVLTGPHAPKGDKSPVAAIFDGLVSKDAQGSCTKCHSVDDIQGKGRFVNFSPASVKSKEGRFTHFIHKPHLGMMENRGAPAEKRGCLTCHELEKGRPYLKSYEQGDPQKFVSNFSAAKKDLCQTCHTSGLVRQDCLLCHKYHVNEVATPARSTRLPIE